MWKKIVWDVLITFLTLLTHRGNISFAISRGQEILAVSPLYINFYQKRYSGFIKVNKTFGTLSLLGGPVLKDGLPKKHVLKIQRLFISYMDDIIKKYNVTNFDSKLSPLAPSYAPDTREYLVNPLIFFGFKNQRAHH